MHVRLTMLAGDPALLADVERYLEGTVRPHVEAQQGNRGMAFLANDDLGVCVTETYWDSAGAMTSSEQAARISLKEMAELLEGAGTVEHYEVPVFVRRTRPIRGAGVRVVRIESSLSGVDGLVDAFRHVAVPALMEMPGMSSAQLRTESSTGRCVMTVAWDDTAALAASRPAESVLRARILASTRSQLRSVEEYRLGFSSVREGDIRSLIERDIEVWNSHDRDGMLCATDLNRFEMLTPGGVRAVGRDAAELIWDMWHMAFPDNRVETISVHSDGRGGVHEGRLIARHTGALRFPSGEIAPTGRPVDVRFCGVYEYEEGKMISYHLYFDEMDLLGQLGLLPPG